MNPREISFDIEGLKIDNHFKPNVEINKITIEGGPFTFESGGRLICRNTKLIIRNEDFRNYSLSYYNPMSGKKYYSLSIYFNNITIIIYSKDEGKLLLIIDKYF